MSFSSVGLNRVAASAPEYWRVFLFERTLPLLGRLRPGSPLPGGARIAGPGIDLVRARPQLVTRLRELGHEVHVWTVDEPADVELCLEARGVRDHHQPARRGPGAARPVIRRRTAGRPQIHPQSPDTT